jgi:hypothetical protein
LAYTQHHTLGYTSHVIFDNYDSKVTSYFVVERASVEIPADTSDRLFLDYPWVAVKNTYRVAGREEEREWRGRVFDT